MNNEHNVELIRRHVLNEEIGDSASVLAEMTDPPLYYVPGVGRYIEGGEAISAIHAGLNAGYEDDMRIVIKEIAANDELGFITIEVTGTLRQDLNDIPAGTFTVMPVCATYTFRNEMVASETIWLIPQRPGLTENLLGQRPPIRDPDEAVAALALLAMQPPTVPVDGVPVDAD